MKQTSLAAWFERIVDQLKAHRESIDMVIEALGGTGRAPAKRKAKAAPVKAKSAAWTPERRAAQSRRIKKLNRLRERARKAGL